MLAIFSKRLTVHLTEGENAKFYFRPLAAGELMELNAWAEDIKAMMAKPAAERTDAGNDLAAELFAQLQFRLLGWQIIDQAGMHQPFSDKPDALSKLLTLQEAMQLLGKMIAANTIGADDQGKSQPPSASNSASDAAPATAANA